MSFLDEVNEITSDVQTLQKELDKYINIIQENIVNELYAQIKNDIKEKASSSQYIRNVDNKLITGTINAISSSHIDNSFLSKIYPKKDVLFKKYPYARCYKDSDNDYGIEFENYIKENETFEFELRKDNPNLIPSFAIKYKYLY